MRKKLFRKAATLLAVSSMMVASVAGTAFAAQDTLYYNVDCGDYVVSTLGEGEEFGIYNSVSDQIYGVDSKASKSWGVVDAAYTETSNGWDAAYTGDKGLRTDWTWPNEWNTAATDCDKFISFRYTHQAFETGRDRAITYKFDLPNGTYKIEVGFNNVWNCAGTPDISANGTVIGDEFAVTHVSDTEFTATYTNDAVTVTDGTLTLLFTDDEACVCVANIKIYGEAPAADGGSNSSNTAGSGTGSGTGASTGTVSTGDYDVVYVIVIACLAVVAAVVATKKKSVQ